VILELQVQQDLPDHKGQLDHLVHLDHPVLQEVLAFQDLQAPLVHLVNRVLQVSQEILEGPAFQECLDRMEVLVTKVSEATPEQLE